jgi:hypothetical protein
MIKDDFQNFIQEISQEFNDSMFAKIYDALQENPNIRETLNPAFPYPSKLRIGIIKKYFVVEYCGPEDMKNNEFKVEGIYQPLHDINDFLNIDIKHLNTPQFYNGQNLEDITFFLGDSISYLCDYFYDITQMPSEFIILNGVINLDQIKEPTYISNTTFFWTDIEGKLRIRHIDFMEIFPLTDKGVEYHDTNSLIRLADFILKYKVPKYRIDLHKSLNEFIELINLYDTTEVQITKYLEENPQILQYAFGLNRLNPQVVLEWQYQSDKSNLKPDFMPERMDGYSDIFEFKMPNISTKNMVGSAERYHPSYEIDSAISQIDCYEEWCSQEINTKWLENTKGIKVLNPVRYLIMGHSKDFSAQDRRKLRSMRNTAVFTYDEFIELVRYQIYRYR